MDYFTGRFDNPIIHIFEPRETINRKSREWESNCYFRKIMRSELEAAGYKEVRWEKKHPGWGAGDTTCFSPVFPFVTQDTNIKCSILVSEIFTILAFEK